MSVLFHDAFLIMWFFEKCAVLLNWQVVGVSKPKCVNGG